MQQQQQLLSGPTAGWFAVLLQGPQILLLHTSSGSCQAVTAHQQ
jgi:hypothetical protein